MYEIFTPSFFCLLSLPRVRNGRTGLGLVRSRYECVLCNRVFVLLGIDPLHSSRPNPLGTRESDVRGEEGSTFDGSVGWLGLGID